MYEKVINNNYSRSRDEVRSTSTLKLRHWEFAVKVISRRLSFPAPVCTYSMQHSAETEAGGRKGNNKNRNSVVSEQVDYGITSDIQ